MQSRDRMQAPFDPMSLNGQSQIVCVGSLDER